MSPLYNNFENLENDTPVFYPLSYHCKVPDYYSMLRKSSPKGCFIKDFSKTSTISLTY